MFSAQLVDLAEQDTDPGIPDILDLQELRSSLDMDNPSEMFSEFRLGQLFELQVQWVVFSEEQVGYSLAADSTKQQA